MTTAGASWAKATARAAAERYGFDLVSVDRQAWANGHVVHLHDPVVDYHYQYALSTKDLVVGGVERRALAQYVFELTRLARATVVAAVVPEETP